MHWTTGDMDTQPGRADIVTGANNEQGYAAAKELKDIMLSLS